MTLRDRQRLYLEQDKSCWYCRQQIPFNLWTIDHRIPRCRGGGGSRENKVGACHACNNLKNLLTEDEFRTTPREQLGQKIAKISKGLWNNSLEEKLSPINVLSREHAVGNERKYEPRRP